MRGIKNRWNTRVTQRREKEVEEEGEEVRKEDGG